MKILLFGRNGQISRELGRTLLPFGDVIALGRGDADMMDPAALHQGLQTYAPDVIVNAAAYTAVDRAESDEAAAFRVNAESVGVLADFACIRRALLVHYSTDYIFDGTKTGPYLETDSPNPLNAYGRSKLAGEEAIRQSGCAALIFRTSWVFSAFGNNFVKTMLRLAHDRATLNVVADQHGAPTSAELIADITALALAAHRHDRLPAGVYHLTATGETTWHGLAGHIVRRALGNGASLKLRPEDIRAIPTEAYPVPAKRPRNSLLDTGALSLALGLQLPDWTIHVNRTVDQLTQTESSR